jgi:hypothetical protein
MSDPQVSCRLDDRRVAQGVDLARNVLHDGRDAPSVTGARLFHIDDDRRSGAKQYDGVRPGVSLVWRGRQ